MKALKANKMFTISEHERKTYLEDGYTILDDNENVIEAPVKDSDLLGKELSEAKNVIAAKDREIAKLNDMIVKLSKQVEALKEAAANKAIDDADFDEDKKPAPAKKTTKK